EGVTAVNGAGPETLRARLVIGADGRRSVVARRLGLLREHPRLRKFAVRGYWSGMEGLEERGQMHVGGGGYCGVAPLSASEANVTFVVDRPEMAAARGELEGFYRRTLRRWPWIANAVVKRLARRPDIAHRMVSIAGDFVPARTALGPGFLLDLLLS